MNIISALDILGSTCALVAFFVLFSYWRKKLNNEERIMISLVCLITSIVNGISAWSWLHENNSLGENWGDYLQILQPAFWGAFFYVVVESARKRELEQSHKNLRDVIEHMPVLLQAFDKQGNVLAWNKKSEELSGKSLQTMQEDICAVESIFPSESDRLLLRNECACGGGDYEGQIRSIHGISGLRQIAWSNISKRFPIPGWGNWGVGLDITEQLSAQRELERMATHDDLTQLPNRSLLINRLRRALADSQRDGRMGALLMLDLDHFKMVNDRHGHPAGDKLLQDLSKRLCKQIKSTDTMARFSGDEFVFLIENIRQINDAETIAKRILAALNSPPFEIYGNEIRASGSLGITIFPDDDLRSAELLKNMDLALYAAKEAGRNSYQFYCRSMHKQLRRRHFIAEKLLEAVEKNELTLHFQPQISLSDESVCGAEALIRWPNFEDGLLSASVFVPIAEKTGIMPKVGEWVIDSGFDQASRWNKQMLKVPLAINLSVLQFYQSNLLNYLDLKLEQYNIEPDLICVEITESAVMRNTPAAIQTMNKLKQRGFRIALDDFGTGHSSFAYLKRLPLDKLKIDESFIQNMHSDKKDAAIVKAIIQLAHNLNLRVVAEGVESRCQQQKLNQSGCDEIQGFYYSKPLTAGAFNDFVSASGMR